MNEKSSNQLPTRREFLIAAAASSAAAALPFPAMAQATEESDLAARLASDPRRPQFHLLPARNWMNDPNGPIYHAGKYHMFFQYNPRAAVWGDMSWYHSVSPDMIHWTHLPIALTPTPDSPDSFGCFSGSALRVGTRVYQVYTGTKLVPKELATLHDADDNIQESQCLAYSDDPQLVKWTKLPAPIIPAPPPGMKITGFRDPSMWKQGDWYYMTVGSGEAKVGGCVLLYRSKNVEDPKSWEYMHKLTSGQWNGKHTPNPCDDGEMWECPDLFALGNAHVLIYSTLGKVFWQSGKLDESTMKFTAQKTGELDLGGFYAPKTQLDIYGRRVLWGWIQEKRSEAEMKAAGWSGMMSLPRQLILDADGTLFMRYVAQTVRLRFATVAPQKAAIQTTLTIRNASGEIRCGGTKGSAFEFTMSNGKTELLHVSYSPERHSFTIDGKETALEPDDPLLLHAFVDASVIELIAGGRAGYTKRFYYAGDTAPDISVVATGSGASMAGWTVAPISPNRLTTEPANV